METARQGDAGVGEETSGVSSILRQLPSLAGLDCQVEPLSGGLTNSNYKVTTAGGRYVVRVAARPGGCWPSTA